MNAKVTKRVRLLGPLPPRRYVDRLILKAAKSVKGSVPDFALPPDSIYVVTLQMASDNLAWRIEDIARAIINEKIESYLSRGGRMVVMYDEVKNLYYRLHGNG